MRKITADVPRRLQPKLFSDKLHQPFQLRFIIIDPRDEQCGNFQPHAGLLERHAGIQDWLQMCPDILAIGFISEGFNIHIRSVEQRTVQVNHLLAHVAVSHIHIF